MAVQVPQRLPATHLAARSVRSLVQSMPVAHSVCISLPCEERPPLQRKTAPQRGIAADVSVQVLAGAGQLINGHGI